MWARHQWRRDPWSCRPSVRSLGGCTECWCFGCGREARPPLTFERSCDEYEKVSRHIRIGVSMEPLTEEYHKSRSHLMLASGFLLAWVLIGLEVTGAAGQPAVPVASEYSDLRIAIKSPQAAPYVVIALIIYFVYRLMVEWLQCDLGRRKTWPARIDCIVSILIAGAAIGLFAYQSIRSVQVASFLSPHSLFTLLSLGAAVLLGQSIGYALEHRVSKWGFDGPLGISRSNLLFICLELGALVMLWVLGGRRWGSAFVTVFAVILSTVAFYWQALYQTRLIRAEQIDVVGSVSGRKNKVRAES